MTKRKKTRAAGARAYNSDLRQARAVSKRQFIVDKAYKLFSKKKFRDVQMEELAQHTQTPLPTLYALFKSKAGILDEVVKKYILGDRYETLKRTLEALNDGDSKLEVAAEISKAVHGGNHERRLFSNLDSMPDLLKSLNQNADRLRYEKQKSVIDWLEKHHKIRDGLSSEEARDILWMLTSREVFDLLVRGRGWTPEKYELWLKGALKRMLC